MQTDFTYEMSNEIFIGNNEFDINKIDELGRNSLFYAAKENNLDCIKFLLSKNVDPNLIDAYGSGFIAYLEDEKKDELFQYIDKNNINISKHHYIFHIIDDKEEYDFALQLIDNNLTSKRDLVINNYFKGIIYNAKNDENLSKFYLNEAINANLNAGGYHNILCNEIESLNNGIKNELEYKPLVILDQDQLYSPIDLIAKKTYLENEYDKNKYVFGYNALYKNSKLKKFIEAASLDLVSDDDFKIIILFDSTIEESVSKLVLEEDVVFAGGYTDFLNRILLKGYHDDLIPTLVHELFHKLMNDMYHNNSKPYAPNDFEAQNAFMRVTEEVKNNLKNAINEGLLNEFRINDSIESENIEDQNLKYDIYTKIKSLLTFRPYNENKNDLIYQTQTLISPSRDYPDNEEEVELVVRLYEIYATEKEIVPLIDEMIFPLKNYFDDYLELAMDEYIETHPNRDILDSIIYIPHTNQVLGQISEIFFCTISD
ncbi:MAG: hypothetical protein ACK4OM_07215 [Alphaproteobacteria bacterium]